MRLAGLADSWIGNPFEWRRPPQATAQVRTDAQRIAGNNILVLSASIGSGHVRAAEAICASAARHDFSGSVSHLDAMQFMSPLYRKIYSDFYLFLVNRYPGVWGYIYRKADQAVRRGILHGMRSGIERMAAMRLMKEISRRRPDAIICTHFLPAEILAHMIRHANLDCPVWVQVTDFDLHAAWVHHGVSGYFTANQEISFLLQKQGVSAHKIHVTGIPVMPAFSLPLDRAECAAELGLNPQRMTVLLSGGGEGMGRLDELAARLLMLKPTLQLIVMAGRNALALSKLQALALRYPGRLVPLGFTTQVERVMASCDFAVIKPGGLTSSECLVMGLPMVLSAPIPGQEERNADYLLEQGVAWKAPDINSLEYRVRELFRSPAKLEAMRARAKALGKAHAARDVLNNLALNNLASAGTKELTRPTAEHA